jgi:hypothetical protein
LPNPVASEPAKRAPSCSPRCQPWENRTGDNLSPGGATSGQRQGRESTGDALTPPLRGWVICGLTVVPRLRRGLHDRARFAGWERWRRAVEIAMRYVPPFTFLVAPGFSPALPCCAQLCQCRLPNTGSAALPTESGQVPGGATFGNVRSAVLVRASLRRASRDGGNREGIAQSKALRFDSQSFALRNPTHAFPATSGVAWPSRP